MAMQRASNGLFMGTVADYNKFGRAILSNGPGIRFIVTNAPVAAVNEFSATASPAGGIGWVKTGVQQP